MSDLNKVEMIASLADSLSRLTAVKELPFYSVDEVAKAINRLAQEISGTDSGVSSDIPF